MAGLLSAPNRDHVVPQMEAGLRASDQPVSQQYVHTLAVLSVYTRHPEFRPVQTRVTMGRPIASGQLSQHQDLVEAAHASDVDVLSAALPRKTARARALDRPNAIQGMIESRFFEALTYGNAWVSGRVRSTGSAWTVRDRQLPDSGWFADQICLGLAD
jgi:hypothetical protein